MVWQGAVYWQLRTTADSSNTVSLGSSIMLVNGTTYHVVAGFAADGSMTLSVNGVTSTKTVQGQIIYPSSESLLVIGTDAYYSNAFMDGRIGEVAIYPAPLPTARIVAHDQAARPLP
jgi:hypothetical protein